MHKIINLPFVKSKDQLGGILTKVVAFETFEKVLCKLVVQDLTTQFGGEFRTLEEVFTGNWLLFLLVSLDSL